MKTQSATKPIVNALYTIPGRRANAPIEASGQIWPNGEFTIGYAPGGGMECELTAEQFAEQLGSAPLDLTIPINYHSDTQEERKPRGQGGLTSYGRRMVRNAVWRMQRVWGRTNLAFCTLTVPDGDYQTAWQVSTDWSRIVRVFFQKLSRFMVRQGLPPLFAAVTELHPSRSENSGAPWLHLHFVIVTRLRGSRKFLLEPGHLRWLWASVIGPWFPDQEYWGSVDNMQVIRRDAGRYMSKYLSKGSTGAALPPIGLGELGWHLPTAWYSVSLPLKRWVRDNIRVDRVLIGWLEEECRKSPESAGFEYLHAGEVPEMSGPGPHYFVGKLSELALNSLIELWIESG